MLQRVDQGIGSGSVSEWGPASSGVVRSAPVHTTAGIPALVILQYCYPKSCAVFLCSACANDGNNAKKKKHFKIFIVEHHLRGVFQALSLCFLLVWPLGGRGRDVRILGGRV